MENQPRSADQKCPRCSRFRSEWRSNNSEGFSAQGITYCCEGCATGGECTCALMQSTPRLEKNVLDSSDAKAKGLE